MILMLCGIATPHLALSLALPDRFFPFFFEWAGKSGLATRDYLALPRSLRKVIENPQSIPATFVTMTKAGRARFISAKAKRYIV